MKNEMPEMNEQTGNTIPFKSPEQLAELGTPAIPAPVVKGVQGSNFEAITGKSIEFSGTVKESIPESISTDQLRRESIARMDGQFGPL